jgi:hypothetical protein
MPTTRAGERSIFHLGQPNVVPVSLAARLLEGGIRKKQY